MGSAPLPPPPAEPRPVLVADVVRSGFTEARHYGSVVALAADGSVAWARGDVTGPILPRSCNKPIQVAAMVRLGLDLPPPLLALACASHSGEDFHVAGVRRILRRAGLTEEDLRTPPDYPLDDDARDEVVRAGEGRTRIRMNCSGKHAAMLATCALHGWDRAGYRDPDHPLQRAIRDTYAELVAEPVAHVAVDGCGVPLLAASLAGLAGAFRRLALGIDGGGGSDTAVARVAAAMRAHPEYVSGTRRDERALLQAVPGAIAKAGAECCYAVALADGRAFAVKAGDGAVRARPVLMAAALSRAGVDAEPGVDGPALRRTGEVPVLGGGVPVGRVRARF